MLLILEEENNGEKKMERVCLLTNTLQLLYPPPNPTIFPPPNPTIFPIKII